MKRTIATLLAAILLISCFPLSALAATSDTAETAAGIEAKFRLLLEDLELKYYQDPEDYFYAEPAQYPEKDPEWVLIRGGLFDNDMPDSGFDYNYATFGNKLIRANIHSAPFRLGWGVYDVKSGAFYDLVDAWNMNLNNLRDVWDGLTITDPYSKDENGSETNMYVIGDADMDGEVSILDATRIQRCLADLDVNPWKGFAPTGADFIRGAQIAGATDYDRDGDTTIMDATRIQRDLAELPNHLDWKLAWDERIENRSPEEYDEKLLITDRSQLDAEKPGHQKILGAYDEGFFKDHCLAALRVDLASGDHSLTPNGVSIDSDGVLNIDFSRSNPVHPTDDLNPRFIVIELPNTFVDSIKDIKVNINPVEPEKKREYDVLWDKKCDYSGFKEGFELITEESQLDPSDKYHADLIAYLGSHRDRSLDRYAYFLAKIPIGSTTYTTSVQKPVIDENGVLQLKVVATGPRIGNCVENSRFICVALSKDWIDDSKDWNADFSFNFTDANEYDDLDYRPAKHPYLYVEGSGEATLYTSRDQLDPALEGHRTLLDDYDDEFFKHAALLTVHYTLPSGTTIPQFGWLVNTQYNKLNVNMVEFEPSWIGDNKRTDVTYCLEINKVYAILSTNGIQVIHQKVPHLNTAMADDSIYNRNVDLDKAQTIPADYAAQGYTKVSFEQGASHVLDLPDSPVHVYSPELSKVRDGDRRTPAGIAAIIDDPYDFANFICDDSLSVGYPNEIRSINYDLCKDYDYDLMYFKDYVIVGIVYHYTDYDPTFRINGLYMKDQVLYIDASFDPATKENPLPPTECDKYVFVKVKRRDIEGVNAVTVGRLSGEPAISTVCAEIPARGEMPGIPDDLAGQGYVSILSPQKIAPSQPASDKFSWAGTPLEGSDGKDYVLLITSRDEMKKYLPQFDKDGRFNDKFFKNNVIIAMIAQGNDYTSTAELDNVAVKGDTLYVNAYVKNTAGETAQPLAPTVWTFRQVDREVVADVKKISFWKPRASEQIGLYAEITPDKDRKLISEVRATGDNCHFIEAPVVTKVDGSQNKFVEIDNLEEKNNGYMLLLRSRKEFLHYFSAMDESGKYTDAFFRDSAILAVYGQGCHTGYEAKLNDIAVVRGTQLYADAGIVDPTPYLEAGETTPTVWTFRKVAQSDVGNVKALSFWKPDSVIGEIDPIGRRKFAYTIRKSGNDRALETAELDVSLPADNAVGWQDEAYPIHHTPLDASDEGYVVLIRNRQDFERYLPYTDKEKKCGDEFFKTYAVVAMIGQGRDEYDKPELNNIAVVDQTLFTDPVITPHIGKENSGGEPQIVWSLYRVKQSDVADVNSVGFWKPDKPEVGEDVAYFREIENHRPDGGSFSEDGEGYLIRKPADIEPALDRLWVDDRGEAVEHDSRDYEVYYWDDRNFAAQNVIALRAFQGSSDTEVYVDSVRRSGENELTVEVRREIPKNPTPDMNWRFIFLRIPNYGRDYTIKVNTVPANWKYSDGFWYRIRPAAETGTAYDTAEICGYDGDKTALYLPSQIDGINVSTIGVYAFKDHTELTSVTTSTGSSVMIDVGYGAFQGCTGLKTAYLYAVRKSNTLGEQAFAGCTSLETVSLGSFRQIGERTFFNCKSLKNVYGTSYVKQIGAYAFAGCESLSEIPEGAYENIGSYAFKDCPSLRSAVVKKKTAVIGREAFGYTSDGKTDGFTVYGYSGSTAESYANDNGLVFKSIDDAGELKWTQEDTRFLPDECGAFSEEGQAIYVTSPDELTAALDTLYDGRRASDSYSYQTEMYNEKWFETHDVVAIRTYLEDSTDYLNILYFGIDYDSKMQIELERVRRSNYWDYTGSTEKTSCWVIRLFSFEKLPRRYDVVLTEFYTDEPLPAPEKPIIYLYPEQETALTVTVGKPQNLTCTYPAYNDGWHVTAKPDGTLYDDSGRSYYALYWEGVSDVPAKMDDGFVVSGADTAAFLEEKLAILGLTEREAEEFIVYWLPKMQNNAYNFIRFATMEEIEEIMPLDFSVQPDSVIRVLMEYTPLDEAIEVAPQTLTTPERTGFVAVEWGGCLIK